MGSLLLLLWVGAFVLFVAVIGTRGGERDNLK